MQGPRRELRRRLAGATPIVDHEVDVSAMQQAERERHEYRTAGLVAIILAGAGVAAAAGMALYAYGLG